MTYLSRQTSFFPQLQRDSLFRSRRYKTAPLLPGNACQMYRALAHFLVHLFLGRICLIIECKGWKKLIPKFFLKNRRISYFHTQVSRVSIDFRRTQRWSIFVLGRRSRAYMSWWLIHRFDSQFVLRLQDDDLRALQRSAYMVGRRNLQYNGQIKCIPQNAIYGQYTFE